MIFPGSLGDLVCLGPAMNALAQRHPGAALELMARAELACFAVARFSFARIRAARAHSIDRREITALFAGDADLADALVSGMDANMEHSVMAALPRWREERGPPIGGLPPLPYVFVCSGEVLVGVIAEE